MTNPNNIIIYHPTRVIFGEGALDQVGVEAAKIAKKCLIVTTGKTIYKKGVVKKLGNLLGKEKVDFLIYKDIKGEPSLEDIEKGYTAAKGKKIGLVIGLGGGSAIDSAKAISACLKRDKSIFELVSEKDFQALPVIAIPTTAGTGSELSKGAILSDKKNSVKVGLRGDSLIPKVAIVDPLLTLTAPKNVTAISGFDAFAHAVESLFSKKANLYSITLSKEAIQTIFKYLPIIYKNGKNKEARMQLSYASMLMGYNLVYSSTCLPHRIQYSFGTLEGMSHGKGLAVLFPAWIKLAVISDTKKAKILADSMGISIENKSWKKDLQNEIGGLLKKLELTYKLRDFNIHAKDVEYLANKVSGNLELDPVYKNKGTINKILKNSL